MTKTINNTDTKRTKTQVKDVEFWGNGDMFKLLSKASSKKEGWMKSTKAMEIKGGGCVVQVTTQQGDNVAEALTYVPSVKIVETKDDDGKVVSRKIIQKFNEPEESSSEYKKQELKIRKLQMKAELKRLEKELKELSK